LSATASNFWATAIHWSRNLRRLASLRSEAWAFWASAYAASALPFSAASAAETFSADGRRTSSRTGALEPERAFTRAVAGETRKNDIRSAAGTVRSIGDLLPSM